MFSPDEYVRAVQEAHCHVQVLIEAVDVRDGVASLSGPVVKVFRGPPDLMNMPMKLQVFCDIPEGNDWPPPGMESSPVDALRPGRLLEALVNQAGSGMEIALDLYTVTDSTSATPQLMLDFNPLRSGRKMTVGLLVSAAVVVLSVLAFFLLR
jgi:hypothetical protein